MQELSTINNGTVKIRLLIDDDIPAFAKMAGTLFHQAYTGMMPEEDLILYVATSFTEEKMQAEWEDVENTFFLVTFNGEPAGYAKLSTQRRPERPEPGKYIELDRLYLDETFHGKRIGKLLMERCLIFCREQGCSALWLNVWEKNTNAIKFYERWGFEHVDVTIRMRDNDPQRALWMRKPL